MKTQHFKVYFHHNNGRNPEKPKGTSVEVVELATGRKRAVATARLYHKDKFVKAKGRFFALRKLMDSYSLTREEKREIMEAYIASQRAAGKRIPS